MMKKFGKLPPPFRPPARLSRGGAFRPDKKPEAPLTGMVQGIKAAKGEEYLSRTLNKSIQKGMVRRYEFRWRTSKTGNAYRELDFLIFKANGDVVPVSVKGRSYVHFGGTIKERDKLSELIILAKLKELGYNAREVISIYDDELTDEKTSDKTARKFNLYK